MSKIYVPITGDEFLRLQQVAVQECRTPHDQARYLLRVGLGLAAPSTNATNPVAQVSEANATGFAQRNL